MAQGGVERGLDVLLVRLPSGQYRDFQEPLGVAYLKAALNAHGLSCVAYNPFHNDFYGRHRIEHPDEVLDNCIRTVKTRHPIVVGLSGNSGDPFADFAKEIKRSGPGTKVICGGHGPTWDHRKLAANPHIDAVVRGEGDVVFPQLVWAVKDGSPIEELPNVTFHNGDPIRVNPAMGPIDALDALPVPDRSYEPGPIYASGTAFVSSSRGCPHRCAFCDAHSFYGKNIWRPRAAENVFLEIERLKSEFFIDTVNFVDDDFLPTREAGERLIELNHLIRSRELWLHIGAQTSVRGVILNRDALAEARGLFHNLNIGVESGSQKLLDKWRKPQTVNEIREACALLRDLGIESHNYFIFGDYDTTTETIRESLFAFLEPETFHIFAGIHDISNCMLYYGEEAPTEPPEAMAFLKTVLGLFALAMRRQHNTIGRLLSDNDKASLRKVIDATRKCLDELLELAAKLESGHPVEPAQADPALDRFESVICRF
jgi:radical SAM superfamily enzyme YgiQ (UPF0313 family)